MSDLIITDEPPRKVPRPAIPPPGPAITSPAAAPAVRSPRDTSRKAPRRPSHKVSARPVSRPAKFDAAQLPELVDRWVTVTFTNGETQPGRIEEIFSDDGWFRLRWGAGFFPVEFRHVYGIEVADSDPRDNLPPEDLTPVEPHDV